MSDVFNEQELMDRVDDDVEFLEETIAMLDEDSPDLLEQIREAAASRDAAALVKPAHALKGMLTNFCAPLAEEAARELEMMGREDRLDDLDSAVAKVKQETERLRESLHQFLRMKTA
jgi:HPt (histidine-containing phosphotransfer) domain-containing protein